MKRRERDAVEAVARHFAATWDAGEGRPDATLTMAGKRIAVDVVSLKHRIAAREGLPKPRLRFDRVVLGLVRRLQEALQDSVPAGEAVIVTVTAPIRLPAKTAAALEDKIRTLLARRSGRTEIKGTIHGNQIRVRRVTSAARRAAKVIAFVHNPDPDADIAALDIAHAMLRYIGAAAERRASDRRSGVRWLVVVNADERAPVETYRQIYAQLAVASDFQKILMVRAGGRVDVLTE